MKQKVVIKLSVHDDKSRSKAMKTAVGVDGVDSASIEQSKGHIEVTGDGVDVVLLTTRLRKSVKFAEVISVNAVGDKKEEKKDELKPMQVVTVGWPQQYHCTPYEYDCRPVYDPNPNCSIM